MPSKLRYLMFAPGETMSGSKAVAMLCKMVRQHLWTLELPKGWKAFKTQARLEFLSQYLPSGYTFLILREPRHTRKNRSRYLSNLPNKGPLDKNSIAYKIKMKQQAEHKAMLAFMKQKKQAQMLQHLENQLNQQQQGVYNGVL